MYKVIVCDDEKEILNSIQISVKESLENNEVNAEYECIDDARILMKTLKEQKIDVLFLDIDMPYFSGMDIAGYINENHLDIILVFVTSHDALVYKTLVTVGKSGGHYVFVIPIEAEIDFKKAAKVVGEKSLVMLPLKDLTNVTGYIRGGCTAVGMKKQFPTVIQNDAEELEYMYVSAGKRGMQIKLSPKDLQKASNAKFHDVTH